MLSHVFNQAIIYSPTILCGSRSIRRAKAVVGELAIRYKKVRLCVSVIIPEIYFFLNRYVSEQAKYRPSFHVHSRTAEQL